MTSQLEILRRLGLTSGRRTYKGNKLVGGVPNSAHLSGTAADFTADEATLRRQFGPGVKILNEGDHRHVSGLSDVPYYGNKGIAGLVNGVDTSAPKRSAMPAKPNTLGALTQRQSAPPEVPAWLNQPDQPMQHTLGSLVGDLGDVNIPEKRGPLGMTQNQFAAVAASLADSVNGAVYGQRGNMLGNLMQQREAEADRNWQRERLDEQVRARREEALLKAAEPPQFVQNAQAFANLPPELKQTVLQYLDTTQPIAVSGPMGTQRIPRSMGGNTQTVNGVTYYNVNGEWYDNPEGR